MIKVTATRQSTKENERPHRNATTNRAFPVAGHWIHPAAYTNESKREIARYARAGDACCWTLFFICTDSF